MKQAVNQTAWVSLCCPCCCWLAFSAVDPADDRGFELFRQDAFAEISTRLDDKLRVVQTNAGGAERLWNGLGAVRFSIFGSDHFLASKFRLGIFVALNMPKKRVLGVACVWCCF